MKIMLDVGCGKSKKVAGVFHLCDLLFFGMMEGRFGVGFGWSVGWM